LYYVLFIDDYSRRTWLYFIRIKSEVFSQFKEFKALLENQTGRKIKVLQIDNGHKFCFVEFDKENGIEIHNTTPYNPQQNGVAEWMNRTLMERERSILSGASLKKKF